MGTPDFSLPTLKAIAKEHQILAVYTQPPKPAGRGQVETLSPVHQLAKELNIPVFTPKTLRKAEAQEQLRSLDAECAIIVAYGLILPQEVIDIFPYGCINIHPSMLPKYRGAAPMQRTILDNEKETAMCIMQMDAGIDTGDILAMEKVVLDDKITYPELSKNMSNLGAKLLLSVLENIDDITPQKQTEIDACYANKITKEEAELNWNEDAWQSILKIRVLNPWPGTFFYHNKEKIKVLAANFIELDHKEAPGSIIDSKLLTIACKKDALQPTILQRPGKAPVAASDFLRGYKFNSPIATHNP